jgi:hypothetical protein
MRGVARLWIPTRLTASDLIPIIPHGLGHADLEAVLFQVIQEITPGAAMELGQSLRPGEFRTKAR